MKSSITLVGILFIVLGVLSLAYQGFTYTQRESVANIGSLNITADKQHTVYFPPLLGGLAVVAGIVLVVVGRNGGNK
ncbi:MAG TPA: DUF3185 domain-containing protein [Gammaproteobacteria bacterium]|nr:DUF3185 domain-containing protein [Gammaproteobacteria bacterium]